MGLSPTVQEVFDRLLVLPSRAITLDDLGDAIGTRAVSSGDVEALMDRLERAGFRIDAGETVDLRGELSQVIGAGRKLSDELGRRPTPVEIADRTGLAEAAVRRALLYARVMSR